MASGDSSDILVRFMLNGHAIAGESSSELRKGKTPSRLLKDFERHHYFEVDNFNFSVGIEGSDSDAGKAQPGKTPVQAAGKGAAQPKAKSTLGGFTAWRAGQAHKKYPVNVQPVSFTRPLDRASSALLQHCIKCTSFDSATIVKRKAAGSVAAGEAYLRMHFAGVLITDVEWSNDDPVRETCKFIARAITVHYPAAIA